MIDVFMIGAKIPFQIRNLPRLCPFRSINNLLLQSSKTETQRPEIPLFYSLPLFTTIKHPVQCLTQMGEAKSKKKLKFEKEIPD
jgi:hypothetical protein